MTKQRVAGWRGEVWLGLQAVSSETAAETPAVCSPNQEGNVPRYPPTKPSPRDPGLAGKMNRNGPAFSQYNCPRFREGRASVVSQDERRVLIRVLQESSRRSDEFMELPTSRSSGGLPSAGSNSALMANLHTQSIAEPLPPGLIWLTAADTRRTNQLAPYPPHSSIACWSP